MEVKMEKIIGCRGSGKMTKPFVFDELDDFNTYDPARDANEEESHFCNSLNAEFGFIRHMINDPVFRGMDYIPAEKEQLARLADYCERAQAVIMYLQKKLEEKNGNK